MNDKYTNPSVTKCICEDTSFKQLEKVYRSRNDISTIRELQDVCSFGHGCGRCINYVKAQVIKK